MTLLRALICVVPRVGIADLTFLVVEPLLVGVIFVLAQLSHHTFEGYLHELPLLDQIFLRLIE